jgi:ABC-type nickel/cobalt efflux system permease component RcnA
MISLLLQSFGYGLLHGILPDEHTWPITFSYAIGNASGKKGLKSGLFFSLAFTIQRSIGSEISYLLLFSWFTKESINSFVNMVVGAVMLWAGWQIQKKGHYLHFHLLGHHHEPSEGVERSPALFGHQHKADTIGVPSSGTPEPFPTRWAMIHGFVAGFGVGPFAMFVYTIAAPQMGSPWLGFLPGFLFGLGTTAMLMILGGIFGASLKTTHKFDDHEIAAIGLRTGSLTLLGGGVVFVVGGLLQEGLHLYGKEIDLENWMIGIIMAGVALPVLVYSIWKVLRCRKDSPPRSLQGVV